MTLMLAQAVNDFHFSFGVGNRREVLVAHHRTVLQVQDHIQTPDVYHRHVSSKDVDDAIWGPVIIEIASQLKFVPGMSAETWLLRARAVLSLGLVSSATIGQRLPSTSDLEAALASPPLDSHPARTIHSAKGVEFAAAYGPNAPVWGIAPFVNLLGTFGNSKYLYQWVRVWWHVGDLEFSEFDPAFLRIQEDPHETARGFCHSAKVDHVAPRYECPFINPYWGEDQIVASLYS